MKTNKSSFFLGNVDLAQGSWFLRTVCQWKTHKGFAMKSAVAPRATPTPTPHIQQQYMEVVEEPISAEAKMIVIFFFLPKGSVDSTALIYRRVFRSFNYSFLWCRVVVHSHHFEPLADVVIFIHLVVSESTEFGINAPQDQSLHNEVTQSI